MTVEREACYQAARELRDLLPLVAALVAQTDTTMESETRHRSTAGLIPWNNPAAMTYYGIHAGLRHHETALSVILFGHATYRPGSDAHTLDCLSRLPVLVAHALDTGHDDAEAVQKCGKDLCWWPKACRAVLGVPRPDERPWTHAPGDLRCPHCDQRLALAPGWDTHPENADLICRQCTDTNGHWYRWAPTLWTGILLTDTEPTDTDGTPLLTVRQAADQLGVEPATIRQWASRGRITPHRSTTRTGARLYRLDQLTTTHTTTRRTA